MTLLKILVRVKLMLNKIKYLFSFSEDAGRLDFFFVWLGLWVFGGGFAFLGFYYFENLMGQFMYLYIILLLIITLANWSRRLNDLNKHPGFVLIIFVPIVQLIFLIYLMLAPGKKYNKSLNK